MKGLEISESLESQIASSIPVYNLKHLALAAITVGLLEMRR
jgi:hypothetical protein